MRADNLLAIIELQRQAIFMPGGGCDHDVRTQFDTLLGQSGRKNSDQFGIVARQKRTLIEHRNAGPKPMMRLCQFDADRPTADHDQMLRQLAIGKDRLIRQIRQPIEPGNRRHRRL
jgi:hypothetical protein